MDETRTKMTLLEGRGGREHVMQLHNVVVERRGGLFTASKGPPLPPVPDYTTASTLDELLFLA
jgi:hypothetical protein